MSNLGAVRYLRFDRKWIFTIPVPHCAPALQLPTQLGNARLSYWIFS